MKSLLGTVALLCLLAPASVFAQEVTDTPFSVPQFKRDMQNATRSNYQYQNPRYVEPVLTDDGNGPTLSTGSSTAPMVIPAYQSVQRMQPGQVVNLMPVEVGYDMTTHIIFPNEIIYADLGSEDIISEKAEKVGNILKVKASVKDFHPTNMTVVTSDGKYFAFMVYYAAFPKTLNMRLSSADFSTVSKKVNLGNAYDASAAVAKFDEVKMNEGEMNKWAHNILKKRRKLHHIGEEKWDMQVYLKGLFVKDNVLFFDLVLRNKSEVNYDIDFFKFYIQDAAVLKRTAQQELQVEPLYVLPEELPADQIETVKGKERRERVACFQRFTIPDQKVFTVEVFEKNGGRKFSFNLTGNDIINARQL